MLFYHRQVGMFCQTTFVTMANVGFSPLMCYAHPDGEESVLQFSGIFCWTSGALKGTPQGTPGGATVQKSSAFAFIERHKVNSIREWTVY